MEAIAELEKKEEAMTHSKASTRYRIFMPSMRNLPVYAQPRRQCPVRWDVLRSVGAADRVGMSAVPAVRRLPSPVGRGSKQAYFLTSEASTPATAQFSLAPSSKT